MVYEYERRGLDFTGKNLSGQDLSMGKGRREGLA